MKIHQKRQLFFLLLFIPFFSFAQNIRKPDASKHRNWFPPFDFNAALFARPPLAYAPFARWWWPGNAVTDEELTREINLFADNGFAGVEIQPMNISFPPLSETEKQKITSWDTPAYYEHLKGVMEQARKRHITVDMTNGSGWPPAAPNLQPEDGFLSLEYSDTTITGGETLSFTLPQVPANKNRTGLPPKLQAVLMAGMVVNPTSPNPGIQLNGTTVKLLTSYTMNGKLSYAFPKGQWKVIAFWAVTNSTTSSLAATPKPLTIVDHFDSLKVLKLYNYLFGPRTGLQPYFGNPMRAVFSDSYEFVVNRHYSPDFIPYFRKHRGYDIMPYLPANMQKAYNYVAYMRPITKPDFSFSEQDWRLRYDYDVTISELLGEHFFKTSRAWAEKRNLLFRTQAYGMNMDMIAMAGLASIPETESMLGSEANLKVMSSGALLYNRPLVTAESVVFKDRAYTTTPQKIKIAVDKLFAAGVNQVIYHGVPYRYTPDKLGPEGWYAFSSPFMGFINFSSNLGEANIFWKHQKAVNEYVSRVQMALQSGKPHADVLIYYPFMDIGEGTLENEEEILTTGYLKDVEAPLAKAPDDHNPGKTAWAKKVFPLINQLEANGITWAWVNDASVQSATNSNDGGLGIRGNHFQALILAQDSIIQLRTAIQIKALTEKGMRLLVTGILPGKQPSYLNWEENDSKTAASVAAAVKTKNGRFIKDDKALDSWIKQLHPSIIFQRPYRFTRQAQRNMKDGSRIRFIWNKSDQWQTLSLTLTKNFAESYWMNPEDGTITKNTGTSISFQLPAYGSVILYATVKKNAVQHTSAAPAWVMDDSKPVITLDTWDLHADTVTIKNSALFDWKTNEQLKFSSAEAVYTSSFDWSNTNPATHYYLDLGKVCFTAEVFINGKPAGTRIYSPYLLNITSLLQPGVNTIEVHITTAQLNDFIGKAKQGDSRYRQFKGKEDQLMSAGLIGPVVIRTAPNLKRP